MEQLGARRGRRRRDTEPDPRANLNLAAQAYLGNLRDDWATLDKESTALAATLVAAISTLRA